MKLYAQLSKVDEEKRLVYGIAAAEQKDRSGEILDYTSSKPHFEKWQKETLDATDGKSHGNLRAMHGNVAAGKLMAIDYDDVNKQFPVCAKIVDDNEWKKVLEGVYTGFSIGGRYEKKWADTALMKDDGKTPLERYTAIPTELSLVDRACIPAAKFFDIQKKDGSIEHVDFQLEEVAKVEDTPEYQVSGTEEEVADLAKVMETEKLDMAFVLKLVTGNVALQAEIAAIKKAEADGTLKKGMYTLSQLAQLLAGLDSLRQSVNWEEKNEADGTSVLPARMRDLVTMTCEAMSDMCAEECGELMDQAVSDFAATVPPDAVPEVMQMMAKSDSFAALRDMSVRRLEMFKGARGMRAQTLHDICTEMGANCTKETTKSDTVDELKKSLEPQDLAKLVADEIAKVQKQNDDKMNEVLAKVAKLEAQPAMTQAILRAVPKGADTTEISAAEVETIAPIMKQDGNVDETATAIKGVHLKGGFQLFR